MKRFILSGISERFEEGSPKYIAGMSGTELFLEIMENTTGVLYDVGSIVNYERSDAYWAGWILARYQWYSSRSFQQILAEIS